MGKFDQQSRYVETRAFYLFQLFHFSLFIAKHVKSGGRSTASAAARAARRGAGRLTIAERRRFCVAVQALPIDEATLIAALIQQRMPDLQPEPFGDNLVRIPVAKLRASVVRECMRMLTSKDLVPPNADQCPIPETPASLPQ